MDILDTLQLIIPLFAGLAALTAFVVIWWRKGRSIEGVADALGLPFAWTVPYDLARTGLNVFTKGSDHEVTNQLSGISVAGAKARFFDHKFYYSGEGKKGRYLLTAALFEFEKPLFPAFTLSPGGFFGRFAADFGGKAIDIPGAGEFSDKYRLSGKDKAALSAFWTPARVHGFIMPARCTAEAAGRWLVFYRFAVTVDAKSYPAFIEEAKSAAEALVRP